MIRTKSSNQSNPKISIIVPVYNAEKYLDRCLAALINQTFKEIEILCINDGSTDGSLGILNRYQKQDNRVRVFSQKNAGPARARNVGLKNMRGEYLMFCDADDWYEPTMCEELYNTMIEHHVDCAQVKTNWYDYNLQNKTVSWLDKLKMGYSEVDTKIKSQIDVYLWNKIFKKDIVVNYNIKFPEGHKSDDNLFIYKYFAVISTMYFIDKKLYDHFDRENSIIDLLYSQDVIKYIDLEDKIFILSDFYKFIKEKAILKDNLEYFKFKLFDVLLVTWRIVPKVWEYKFLDDFSKMLKSLDLTVYNNKTFYNKILLFIKDKNYEAAIYNLNYELVNRKWELDKYKIQEELFPMRKKSIPIVFNCDNSFTKYMSVAIQSIISNASSDNFYDIIILHHDISDQNIRILKQYYDTKFSSIRFYNMKKFIHKYKVNLWFTTNHIKSCAYYRIFVSEIFSHFEKLIYLDADLILKTDIAKLYNEKLGDNVIGAVKDFAISNVTKDDNLYENFKDLYAYLTQTLKIEKMENYFNSGVLLIDVKKIKKYFNAFVNTTKINNRFFHDQNILNSVLQKKCKALDISWNIQQNGPNSPQLEFYSLKNAKILHFCSKCKPWNTLHWKSNEISIQWWMYARLSPFYEKILFDTVRTGYSPSYKFPLKDILNFPKAYWAYLRCRIWSNFTWGKKRQHYLYKKHVFHNEVRRIRKLLK